MPGPGPLRVVELAADVEVRESEVGVPRRDVLLTPRDAGPAHVDPDVGPGVAQDAGERYGVAPHPAADLQHVMTGPQGAVPRVRGQVGGGYPVPRVGAPTGQDGQVDRDVEALEGERVDHASSALDAAIVESHVALGFGSRAKVVRSTPTSPPTP